MDVSYVLLAVVTKLGEDREGFILQKFIIAATVAFLLMALFLSGGSHTSPTEFKLNIVQATPMPPPPTAEEMAKKSDDALRWKIIKWGMAFIFLLSGVGVALRFTIVPTWKSYMTIEPDEKGMFPMVRGTWSGRDANGHKVKYEFYHDQNTSITPGTIISKNGNVEIAPQMDGPIDMHADFSSKMLGYLGIRAMGGNQGNAGKQRGMNKAETDLVGGVVAHRAREQAAKADRAELRLLEAQQKAMQLTEPAEEAHIMTMDEAVMTSSERGFVIGYTEDGRKCKLDIQTAIHCMIVGSTGTGKTSSVGVKMMIDAIRHGYHTVILDGAGGNDLEVLAPYAEWHNSDENNFTQQMLSILSLHKKRQAISREERKSLTPVAIFVEEFNVIWSAMNVEDKEACEEIFKLLIRLGRHSRIHLVIIGQEAEEWPKTTMNIKGKIVFSIGLSEAARLVSHKAVNLADNGEFVYKDTVFKAWLWMDTRTGLDNWSKHVSGHNGRRVEDVVKERNSSGTVEQNGGTAERHWNGIGTALERVERQWNGTVERQFPCGFQGDPVEKEGRTVGGEGTPSIRPNTPPLSAAVPPVPLPLQRVFDKGGEWEDVAKKYFEHFPNGSQSDLRQIMSHLDGKNPNSYKRKAHSLYHQNSPNGNNRKDK